MALRGRKPTPRELLELGGRVHKKKFERVDLGAFEDSDEETINFDDLPVLAKERAQGILKLLRKNVVLNSCDVEAFCRYIQHLRIAYEADAILKRDGIMTKDENGLIRKHPALQIHRDNSLAALRFEEQFGLTPSARMRLRSVEENQTDREKAEFTEFLNDI